MKFIQYIPTLLTLIASAGIISFQNQIRHKISYFLMGFFRDLGRIKAHRRRMKQGNGRALLLKSDLEILLRKDDPLKYIKEEDMIQDLHTTYTEEELLEYGNGLDGKPILLSLFGRVYDVTKGSKYYGEDGRYSMFAGREVTRALSTGCMEEECLGTDKFNSKELTEEQLNEGKRWLSFFQLHDKYSHVGTLVQDGVNFMIDELVIESLSSKNVSEDDLPVGSSDGEDCITMG